MPLRSKPFISNNLDYPERPEAVRAAQFSDPPASPRAVFAHSFEFVAKPSEASSLQGAVTSALTSVLKDVSGFAGCLVMVASLEARLVNVVTLWKGANAHKRSAENVRWIQTILTPYMDHRLRLQTYLAMVPEILIQSPATKGAGECFIQEEFCPQREEVCLA